MSLENEHQEATQLAYLAGQEICKRYRRQVITRVKADNSPVTEADLISTEIILNGLQSAFPHDGVVSEESEDIQGGRTWYVDPLDGTKGFLWQTDQFAVHIGLCIEQAPILGVVYKPIGNIMYSACKDAGAFRHALSNSASFDQLQCKVTQSERWTLVTRDRLPSQGLLDLIKRLGSMKLLFSGGEGIRMLKVAENIADAYIQPKAANTWDVCAPHAILSAAGVIVEYVDGTPIVYEGQREMTKRIYAANSENLAAKIKEAERETCLKSTL